MIKDRIEKCLKSSQTQGDNLPTTVLKLTKIFEEYKNEIVDACAGSFECDLDDDGNPVFIWATVLDVKNKII